MEWKFSGIKFWNFWSPCKVLTFQEMLYCSDGKLLFHSKKFWLPVPLCRKFLSETEWNGSVPWDGITNQKISKFTVPFATQNFRNFKPEFLVEWNRKRPGMSYNIKL